MFFVHIFSKEPSQDKTPFSFLEKKRPSKEKKTSIFLKIIKIFSLIVATS
jgi:hypothetical protein